MVIALPGGAIESDKLELEEALEEAWEAEEGLEFFAINPLIYPVGRDDVLTYADALPLSNVNEIREICTDLLTELTENGEKQS